MLKNNHVELFKKYNNYPTEMKILLAFLLICCCQSFLIDEKNYFYLNTSYSKTTLSFSFCFRFSEPTVILFYSPALIPTGEHKTVAIFNESDNIMFDPPFNPENVGYNSKDVEQYWFGVKHNHPNAAKANFEKIYLFIQQESRQLKYIFLLSLLNMPTSGLQVFPINTLYSCGNQLLVSYQYSYSQLDLYLFGASKDVKLNVTEEKDWGFKIDTGAISYLRQKSKLSSQASITAIESENIYKCVITADTLPKNDFSFEQSKNSYTLSELLKDKAINLSAEVTAVLIDL